MDTKIDLEELERLAALATPGPWRVESEVCRDSMGLFWPITSIEGAEDNVTENVTTGDAAYIVAACNSLPGLIAENRALRERVRELERQREWLAYHLGLICSNCTSCFITCPFGKPDYCGETSTESWIEVAKEATSYVNKL